MFSTDPYFPQTPAFDFNHYLIPCTAKCIQKQTDQIISQLNDAYEKKIHQEALEKTLMKNLLLSEREIINPDNPEFQDIGFPGHWTNYKFEDENWERGNFLDFIKAGIHSHRIISLDDDPIARALLMLQPGDHFSIMIKNKRRHGVVTKIFDYHMSKLLLRANSCIFGKN